MDNRTFNELPHCAGQRMNDMYMYYSAIICGKKHGRLDMCAKFCQAPIAIPDGRRPAI